MDRFLEDPVYGTPRDENTADAPWPRRTPNHNRYLAASPHIPPHGIVALSPIQRLFLSYVAAEDFMLRYDLKAR